MSRVAALALILVIASGVVWAASPELSNPSPSKHPAVQTTQPNNTQQKATSDQHGTDSSPLVVKILEPQKNQQEISQEQNQRQQQTANEQEAIRYTKYAFWLGVVQGLIFLLQLGAFAYQGYWLRKTVIESRDISTGQTIKLGQSAAAMERVAGSMERNLGLTQDIVRQQRVFSRLNMRAYLHVVIAGGLYQQGKTRFQLNTTVVNAGNTPAHKVKFRAKTDVLLSSINEQTGLPLPTEWKGGAPLGPQRTIDLSIPIAEGTYFEEEEATLIRDGKGDRRLFTWGEISYFDVFKKHHTTKFCYFGNWYPDSSRPNGIGFHGYYTDWHNDAD